MRVTLDQVAGGHFIGKARESQLVIDKLPEQGGSVEGFRPTELLLLALGSCMMGTLWTFAENQGIPVQGIHLDLLSEEFPQVAEELGALYEEKGVTTDKEIIVYCRLSHRASFTWFVLTYLLGYPRVRVYDGSWTEWGSVVGVPIEK